MSAAAAAVIRNRVGANALKRQCHHAINAFGSHTPPEIFVYRGNAYRELDQPYLALADYMTASRVITLTAGQQDGCWADMKKLPPHITVSYPAADAHLHLLVDPLLGMGVSRRGTAADPVMGRGVFASTDLGVGDVVLGKAEPWLTYPVQEGHCSACAKKLPQRVIPCSNEHCHEEYCSRECRAEALTLYHGKVCTNEGFQGVELDLFSQMTSEETSISQRNVLSGYLLTMRVVAAALLHRSVPSALAEVRSLSGLVTLETKSIAGPMLDLYDKLARFCGFSTSITFEEFIGVYARIRSNSFQTSDSIAWNVPRSMLNHSCDPNVVVQPNGLFVTNRRVAAGDELFISYYPHLNHLPSEARRIELTNRDFVCRCRKCAAGH